jgi:hypothetical protein
MDYFADSRWGESLPKVLAAFAVESVSGSGQFETVVGAEAAAVQGDFDLLLTARRFEADYATGAPVARAAFDCVLLGGRPAPRAGALRRRGRRVRRRESAGPDRGQPGARSAEGAGRCRQPRGGAGPRHGQKVDSPLASISR